MNDYNELALKNEIEAVTDKEEIPNNEEEKEIVLTDKDVCGRSFDFSILIKSSTIKKILEESYLKDILKKEQDLKRNQLFVDVCKKQLVSTFFVKNGDGPCVRKQLSEIDERDLDNIFKLIEASFIVW